MADLRESGAIEQDADIVYFIHHENGKTSLIVAKHRNGKTDDIETVFLGSIQKFTDAGRANEFAQQPYNAFAGMPSRENTYGIETPDF